MFTQQRRICVIIILPILNWIVLVTSFSSIHNTIVTNVIRRQNDFKLSSSSHRSSLLSNHYHPRKFLLTASIAAVNGDVTSSSSSSSSKYNNNVENIRLNVNEKARTVTSICTSGTLCTISSEDGIEGSPFGTFVDYVLDDIGNPILLMNEMSMHTINIRKQNEKNNMNHENDNENSNNDNNNQNAMVTLFTQLGNSNPMSNQRNIIGSSSNSQNKGLQDASRCSITGILIKMDINNDPQMDQIRMKYSLTHTYADQVMDSPKFAFYKLIPYKIYFVGGFGVLAKWINPIEYQIASPDILAKDSYDIIERVNRDHIDDLRYVAEYLLNINNDIEIIRMTNIDRLGIDIRVTSKQGTRRNKLQTDEFRIGFRIPIKSTEDAKSEVLKIFQEAWEIGNGFTWADDTDDDPNLTGTGTGTGTGTTASTINIPIMKIAADSLE